MTSPLTTTGVDVNFKDPTVIAASAAQASGTAVPNVGSNEVARWDLWDPNRWWTDWRIPPKPQATWERWFDWVQQLQRQTPAIRAAAADWRQLTTQLDNGLQEVQRLRPDLATWTGPTGQTMSQSLDNLERATRTRADAIRNNPEMLERLASSIEDAVGPMTALDGEYQQVLTNDAQCRQVALRGAPIMLGLADQLLTVGNTLQNSTRDETRAPMAAPVLPLALQSGEQGPAQQLTQVAGSSGNVDPGTSVPGTVLRSPALPTAAPSDSLAAAGGVATGTSGRADLPTVSGSDGSTVDMSGIAAASTGGGATASGADRLAVSSPMTTDPTVSAGTVLTPSSGAAADPTMGSQLPDVMLAGGGAGTMAPAAPVTSYAAPAAGGGMPAGPVLAGGGVSAGPVLAGGGVSAGPVLAGGGGLAAGGFGGMATGAAGFGGVASGGTAAASGAAAAGGIAAAAAPAAAGGAGLAPFAGAGATGSGGTPVLAPVVAPATGGGTKTGSALRPGATGPGASGRVAVPGGLMGRTGGPGAPVAARGSRRADAEEETDEVLDAEVWRTDPSGAGLVRPQDR